MGAYKRSKGGKWAVHISINDRWTYFGVFSKKREAVAVSAEAERLRDAGDYAALKALKEKYRQIERVSPQPCWTCENACGGCSWSRNLTPVEGWDAELVRYGRPCEGEGITWEIKSCPQYKEESRRK